MSTVTELRKRVREGGLLAPGRPVLVMLSGGRDSVCLLDVAVCIAGAPAVSALHVNYGLRESAAGDHEHCERLCAELGVVLHGTRPGAPTLGNLQAWARDVRYGAAVQFAAGSDIAAGHTATDQVETVLYRLASSPSRRALLGMKRRDGALIRPLLEFSREQTAEYCRERGLQWREDESNDSDSYARNRVRNRLVPDLREIHPGAEQNVLSLVEILRDEAAALDDLVDDALHGASEIRLAALLGLPSGVARMVVQRLADTAAGGPAPGTARRLGEILAMRETGTTHLDLPHGVRATVTDGTLRFSAK